MWEKIGPVGEYLAFVALAAGVSFAVAAWLKRHRPQVRLPRVYWLFLGAVALAGFIYVESAGRTPQQRLITLFEGVAPTYADELSRMGHAFLEIETAQTDPRYVAMVETLKRWSRLNPLVSDIYTYRMRADGAVVLMVDAETDYDGDGVFTGEREARTRPGEVYPQAGPELRRAFKGEKNFMTRPVTDRWGTWVSVHVPMYDASGRVEAVLGMDYRADLWLAESAGQRRAALGYLGAVWLILLGSGASLAVYRQELRARRESDARLDLYVQQMPLAYVEWGPDFTVSRWNPAATRIFGYTADEVRGKKFWELIVPEALRSEIECLGRRLQTGGQPIQQTNDNLTKDGRIIHCEWQNTPLVDANGAWLGVASHAQDITERVRLEQHLRQTQKLESMGQLASGVAHEFNNLLTPMLVQTGRIQSFYANDARLLELLRPVEDSIMQAAELNQRILAVGRRQSDALVLGDLSQMAASAVDLFRLTLDRRIELELGFATGLPPAFLSRGAIVQVVMNLALNARDALLARLAAGGGGPGWTPRLAVTTGRAVPPVDAPDGLRAAGECLHLTVEDNGEGMSAEVRRRVFEPFFTTKPAGQGTGLGLAVVLSVVEGMGGYLELRSTPGAGSTFTVYLPVGRREDVPSLAPDERGAAKLDGRALAPRRILLVDDNALIRETIGDALRRAGHRVVAAADGEAGWRALEEAASRPFDLLITDLNLPRLSGWELLARNSGQARAVVVLSGMLDARLEPGEHRVRRVLRKPIGLAELLEVVEEVTVRREPGAKTA
jgi:PAS domain S-box-containing protein